MPERKPLRSLHFSISRRVRTASEARAPQPTSTRNDCKTADIYSSHTQFWRGRFRLAGQVCLPRSFRDPGSLLFSLPSSPKPSHDFWIPTSRRREGRTQFWCLDPPVQRWHAPLSPQSAREDVGMLPDLTAREVGEWGLAQQLCIGRLRLYHHWDGVGGGL